MHAVQWMLEYLLWSRKYFYWTIMASNGTRLISSAENQLPSVAERQYTLDDMSHLLRPH
jgi:hypothetical protein